MCLAAQSSTLLTDQGIPCTSSGQTELNAVAATTRESEGERRALDRPRVEHRWVVQVADDSVAARPL